MARTPSISPAVYSGGAVVLHQPNFVNYYAQAMAHREAKQQAISQYYDRLGSSINPAGVRSQDMEGWMKKTDDWNRFGIDNRDKLINPRLDGGKALAEFQSRHRDLLGDVNKSKQAAAKELALGRIYADPNKAKLATQKDMILAHQLSSPIYSPDHYKEDGVTPHGLDEFSFNAPPYDINKQRAVGQLITRGLKRDRTFGKAGAVDPETRLTKIPYTEQHSSDNLKTIAQRMGEAYDGDPSIQQYYENQNIDPDTFDKRNKAYQSVYGKGQDIGTDYKKHAIADQIIANSQQNVGAEMRSVSRPPVGRGQTKAQQDQQLMLDLTNQLSQAIKTGNVNEAQRLASTWFSGNGKSTYQKIDQGINAHDLSFIHNINPKGFVISHVDKVWVPDDPKNPSGSGAVKDVLNQDVLDPDDPQLPSKIAHLHQSFMGSTPGLEKGIVSQTLKQNAPPQKTATAPKSNTKQDDNDPLGFLK